MWELLPSNLKCFHVEENLQYITLAVGNLCNSFVLKYKDLPEHLLGLNIIEDISNNQNVPKFVVYYSSK